MIEITVIVLFVVVMCLIALDYFADRNRDMIIEHLDKRFDEIERMLKEKK